MLDSIHLILHNGYREGQWLPRLTCRRGDHTCWDTVRVHPAISPLTLPGLVFARHTRSRMITWETGIWCAVFRSGLGADARRRPMHAPQDSGLKCFEADPRTDCMSHATGQMHPSMAPDT